MKPIKELVRERGTDDPRDKSHAAIARAAYVQRMLQFSAAASLAVWLRSKGEDVPPFAWSYER